MQAHSPLCITQSVQAEFSIQFYRKHLLSIHHRSQDQSFGWCWGWQRGPNGNVRQVGCQLMRQWQWEIIFPPVCCIWLESQKLLVFFNVFGLVWVGLGDYFANNEKYVHAFHSETQEETENVCLTLGAMTETKGGEKVVPCVRDFPVRDAWLRDQLSWYSDDRTNSMGLNKCLQHAGG